ncbi:response regulator [Microbacterium sp. NIBRBAC000506063]|nr:response regulator [Microbacterium sp. NIBRBAC000506063]
MSAVHDASEIRTLIVDDDPAARRLHSRFVSDAEGFVVVGTAGRGETAVREASRADVDLVLLDIQLPDYSGVEVLNRLRAVRGGAVDVIVVSSARDRVTVRQVASAHVFGYLVKPFTREALLARLEEYRESRRSRAEEERDLALGQGEIDRLIGGRAPESAVGGAISRSGAARSGAASGAASSGAESSAASGSPLPKGLSEVTLAQVVAQLDPVSPVTVLDLAARAGLSRATARRYLDHLVQIGAVDISHRYGRRGRPEVLYRRAPG